ncbi:unnamed protein product [Rotaria sp. Silwood2]|nr:unnamed protein product [Rotaria sp. Silwood2]
MKAERDDLMFNSNQRGATSSKAHRQRIDERINELIRQRNQKLQKAYTRPIIQPPTNTATVPRPKLNTQLRPDITKKNAERDKIALKMTPVWFQVDDSQAALKGIVYPPNTVEHRPFNTVARYRMITGQSNNFRQQALGVGENFTETLILMLDAFAQQFGADLSFTNDDLPFDKSAYRTICGTQARSGFKENAVLQYIKPAEYSYTLAPMISYLQIRPSDFVPKHNIDYRKSDLSEPEQRGGYPFYLPVGWYCHRLKVDQKYPNDDVWFGSANAKGEWPVAFHGTHSSAVNGIDQPGSLISTTQTSIARQRTMEQIEPTMDQSEINLTTHCNGGAHPHYTRPFCLEMPDKKNKTLRIVFMCRAQPGKFTTHQVSASTGHVWRFVDPDAIRPYGILIKDEDVHDN